MADQNARNQDQGNEQQDKGKAMGAGTSGSYQGQHDPDAEQGPQGQRNFGGSSQPNETAGQGGGMQGTGQRQSNPGGYSGGQGEQRDDRHRGDASSGPDDKTPNR